MFHEIFMPDKIKPPSRKTILENGKIVDQVFYFFEKFIEKINFKYGLLVFHYLEKFTLVEHVVLF